jgi:cellulose synthase/poly-beta-1,6-N-acetylglucosamine synthase-like glycosyltransferase
VTLERAVRAVECAASPPEEVIVIDDPEHRVSAAARNAGARRAAREILVFVDADVKIHADAFARIRAAFDGDPTLTAVFGAYDDESNGGSVISDFRNLLHHHVHRQSAVFATTFWTGLGAVRRDAFLRVGASTRRWRGSETSTSVCALRREGGVIVLDPSIQGKHLKRWTLTSMIGKDLRLKQRVRALNARGNSAAIASSRGGRGTT